MIRCALRLSLALALLAVLVPSADAITLPNNFWWDNVAPGAGFVDPVALAFSEDGRIFVAEKRGKVQILELPNGASINNGWVKRSTPFLEIDAEVLDDHDRGMLGMVLDPDFSTNGHIYLAYSVETDPGTPDAYQYEFLRVSRFTTSPSDSNVADPASQVILVGETWPTGVTSAHDSHSTGTLFFGSDGTLMFSAGDGAHYDGGVDAGGRDPSQFLPGRSDPIEDIGAFRANSFNSHSGRVLRIDPATGDGIPSNPWYNVAEPRSPQSRTWAMGLRNPYRGGIRTDVGSSNPADANPGVLYLPDVGWTRWEELNIARGGENFGWPCYEGSGVLTGYQAASPTGDGECPPDASYVDAPAIEWPHSSGIGSSQPVPGITGQAAAGAAYYNATGFPMAYRNALFFGDYPNSWIRYARLDANGGLTGEIFDFATGMERPVELKVDPFTGGLLYISWTNDQIRRIRYTGPSGAGVPPVVPVGLSASPGNAQVQLGWQANAEADVIGYNVYRSLSPGGPWTQINVAPVVNTNFVDDGAVAPVSNGVAYYYTVEALDAEQPQQQSPLAPEVVALPSAKAWEWYVPVAGPTLTLPEAPAPFPRTLGVPVATGVPFDHWTTKDYAPQLRRYDMPGGDWTLATRVSLTQYTPGANFNTGLLVAFGDYDLFYWGFYQGTNLRMERSGSGNLANVTSAAETISLRIVKSGDDYSFEYRENDTDPWSVGATQTETDPVQHVGWLLKTWETNALTTVDMDYLALNEISPMAAGSASPESGPSPLTVQFTSSSFDPDGDILTHDWDFGDGSGSTESDPEHIYAAPGGYDVWLTVQDGSGVRDSVMVSTIAVAGNTPPTATILVPLDGDEYIDPAATLQLSAGATDVEDDPATLSYDWSVDLYVGGVPTLGYLTPSSGMLSSFVPNTLDDGTGVVLDIILTVTDSQFATAADTVRIYDHSLPPVALVDLRAALSDGLGAPAVPGAASPWVDLAAGHDAALQGFLAPDAGSGFNGLGSEGHPYHLAFDGVDDVAVIPAASIPELGAPAAASVELWLRTPSDVDTRSYLLEWLDSFAAPFAGLTLAIQGGEMQIYLDPWLSLVPVAPERWMHLVVAEDASGVSAYLDGALAYSGPGANLGPQTSELVLGAGTYAGAGQYRDHFAGAIAEARVYDFALTAGNVSVRHVAGLPLYVNPPQLTAVSPSSGINDQTLVGVQIQGSGFLDGASVFLRRGGESELAATAVSFVSEALLSCDLPLNGLIAGAWDVVVVQPNALEGILVGGFTVNDPPLLVFELDASRADGSAAPVVPGAASPWIDRWGGIPAGLQGFTAPGASSGWQGSGVDGDPYRLRFDGVDDVALIAPGAIGDLQGVDDATVEVWFAPGADVSRSQVVLEWLNAYEESGYGATLLVEGGTLQYRYVSYQQALGNVAPGQYVHVAAVSTAAGIELYLDGAPVGSIPGPSFGDQISELALGAGIRAGVASPSEFFEGEIVDVRVHRAALDAATIAAIYAADISAFLPQPSARLMLTASRSAVGLDSNVFVDLLYDDTGQGYALRGGSFELNFDPAVLQYIGSGEGGLLPSAAPSTFFAAQEIAPGTIKLDATILGSTSGASGSGTLARLELALIPSASELPTSLSLSVGSLIDTANPPLELPRSALGLSLDVDKTPPANGADLTLAPMHETVRVNWTPPGADYEGVTLFYRPWSLGGDLGYPEYDDAAAAPAWPATLIEAREPANGWIELNADATQPLDLAHAGRTALSILVLSRDAAGNLADIATAPRARAVNYVLGDLGQLDATGAFQAVYDGSIDGVADLPVLSLTYGASQGDPEFDSSADIGPTDTGTGSGVPLTDDTVDFEDLMVFSQNFGPAPAKSAAAVAVLSELPSSGPLRLLAGDPIFESRSPGEMSAERFLAIPLRVQGNAGQLKGLHLELEYDPAQLRYRGSTRADVLDLSNAPVALFTDENNGVIRVDVAVLGRDAHLQGDGTFAWLEFELRGELGGGLRPRAVDARGVAGESLDAISDDLARSSVVPAPRGFLLHPAVPNPFNPQTTIRFETPRTGLTRLSVYDVAGRLVRTLHEGELPAGYHAFVWNGSDDRGHGVASGVYLYELSAPSFRGVNKMVLMK